MTGWDWEADMRMRTPSADAAMQRWWARRMRAAATPGTVRALMNMNDSVDVRQVLPSVRVPTLVLHRSHDALFSVDEARYVAERIPGAQLRILEGADHFVSGDPNSSSTRSSHSSPDAAPSPRSAPPSRLLPFPSGAAAEEVTDLLVTSGGRRRVTESGPRAWSSSPVPRAPSARRTTPSSAGRPGWESPSPRCLSRAPFRRSAPAWTLAVALADPCRRQAKCWASAAVGLLLPASRHRAVGDRRPGRLRGRVRLTVILGSAPVVRQRGGRRGFLRSLGRASSGSTIVRPVSGCVSLGRWP